MKDIKSQKKSPMKFLTPIYNGIAFRDQHFLQEHVGNLDNTEIRCLKGLVSNQSSMT